MQIGTFEAEEVAVLRKSFADTDVFVDIGANIGYYTCLARQAGNHVVAVEPVPQNLEFLYANLRANRWLDIEVFPVALSEQSGIGLMFGGGTGASLIAGWAGASEVWQTPVPLTTLDVLLGDRFKDQRLLIKMDVEGAELGVLRGAEMTLTRKLSPIWFIEVCLTENQPTGVNSSFAAVFELFWKFGYTARTGDRDARLVTPENVKQWVNEKRREFGSANYLFSRA